MIGRGETVSCDGALMIITKGEWGVGGLIFVRCDLMADNVCTGRYTGTEFVLQDWGKRDCIV